MMISTKLFLRSVRNFRPKLLFSSKTPATGTGFEGRKDPQSNQSDSNKDLTESITGVRVTSKEELASRHK